MTRQKGFIFALVAIVGAFLAAGSSAPLRAAADDDDSSMRLQESETIKKTFILSAEHKVLDVDDIFGSIDVVGGQGNQVQLVVNKTIYAEAKDRLETAKKEVTLDITEQPDLLKLYVNGPFRCDCNNGHGGGGCVNWHDSGYTVKYDFQLQVPRNLEVRLRTVNSGHVNVRDVAGNFSVHNVNGAIEMQNVAGSGTAKTVNGGVKISFVENPRENSDFGTINGRIDLYFAHGLSADFRFKTMNGAIYSDFEMTSLPARPVSAEHRGSKFVFHTDRFTGGRIGNGGPEIKAENLNGDIRVLERE